MSAPRLAGLTILIVEDEPLIAFDLATAFEREGATVKMAHQLEEAFSHATSVALSAAVLDHSMPDDSMAALCDHLVSRSIPFVHYTGRTKREQACMGAPVISKPARSEEVIEAVADLVNRTGARAPNLTADSDRAPQGKGGV